jgi:hypothetical protein
MNDQRLPSAIHFSMNLRIAKAAFHRYGHTQADVPVARTGINVGLKVTRQGHIHATVARMDIPSRVHSRAVIDSRLNAAIPGFNV